MWLEDKISFKIAISVQQIFVSQKFMELVVKSKKYSRQSLINNLLLIHHVISAMPTLLAILLDIFAITLLKKRTAIGKHLLKADGSLCHLKNQLRILCKCCTKCECLVNEVLLIK